MKLIPLQSSQIAGVGYDEDEHKLIVQFANGSFYEYDDVPEQVVLSVILADSQGSAFTKKIKGGGYAYRKMGDDEVAELHV